MESVLPPNDANATSEIDRLKIDVAELQRQMMSNRRRWYHDASSLVAVLAFIFSLATTTVSYIQTRASKIDADRTALRQFMQRLLSLPEEMTAVQREYGANPGQLEYMLSLKREENTAIARQAVEVIDRIHDHVSTVECTVVINALIETTNDPSISRLLDLAEKRATDLSERVYVIRDRARYLMLRNPEAGRREFRRALNVVASTPPADRLAYDAETVMYWTEVEVDCAVARQHLAEAVKLSRQLGSQSAIAARVAAQMPNPNACRPPDNNHTQPQ